MQILDPKISDYVESLLPERDSVLHEMERLAQEKNFPIVGPLVGRLCYQMVRLLEARRVFEMGSGFGYSAYWMALALPENGKIICTERSEENIERAEKFFQEGGQAGKVEFRHGDALEIIQTLEGQFDVILNDIDKRLYPQSLDLIVPRLRTGGLLITDNIFWHGRVLEKSQDPDTEGVVKYTKWLFDSKELWTTIIPLRDGLALSLKL